MSTALWHQFEGCSIENCYFLNRLLGAGGFGGVFLADHLVDGIFLRRVAVKLIPPDPENMQRQLGELIAATTLRHAHLLGCFHASSTVLIREKFLYLVMELAEETLESHVARGLLTVGDTTRLLGQVAGALGYLHRERMVHRDLKPGNILRVGEIWKVSDFGTIRQLATTVSHTGLVMGTISYMPPESFDGVVSPAWDMWSLGVVVLRSLTGQVPFAEASEHALMKAILSKEPTIPCELEEPLAEIIRGCLIKDYRVRWSAQHVLETLDHWQRQQRAGVIAPSAAESAQIDANGILDLVTPFDPSNTTIEAAPEIQSHYSKDQDTFDQGVCAACGAPSEEKAATCRRCGAPLGVKNILDGPTALRVAVELAKDGLISKEQAVLRVAPNQLDQLLQLLYPIFDRPSLRAIPLIANGTAAWPGVAVGRVVFTADDAAVSASPTLLVCNETKPDDIHGMEVVKGILTVTGGNPCHAAIVARRIGVPCIVNAGSIRIDERKRQFTVRCGDKDYLVTEGDWISIDGATGDTYLGQARTNDPEIAGSGLIATFMGWVDNFRGKFGVRANADLAQDAKVARRLGAEGILCRTEQMFFAEDRMPHMQVMILARDAKNRRKALLKLLPMLRKDFADLFTKMDGFPVGIRTLKPPLKEFLPRRDNLMVDIESLPNADPKTKRQMSKAYDVPVGELKKHLWELLDRIEELHRLNPMLGRSNYHLAITCPEIIEMQARAIFEAQVQVAKKGVKVIPEVTIPLIGSVEAFANQKKIVVRVANEVMGKADMKDLKYKIGCMIEIPRAALTADLIARDVDFFTFGTDDLTQATLGLSLVDYTKFQKQYENANIFKHDPSAVLDQPGIGDLVEMCVKLGRQTHPGLEIGLCGEQSGEPSSVQFCYRVGLNYVSCSPHRVPIARLAAAQAAISGDK